jgi:F-type H+-transporting ATPase subunit gamma
MASLKDIKRRIKSVKSTQQITKAMKMVSAAKLRRAQEDIIAARPYADKMLGMISTLSANVSPEDHPLLAKVETNKVEVILIASDRGLCGGFNSSLLRTAERFIEEHPDSEISLNLMGKRAVEYFKRRAVRVAASRPVGVKRPDYAFGATVARELIDSFLKDGPGEVYLVYSVFKSALTQRPVVQKLLPITPQEVPAEAPPESKQGAEEKEGAYLFEPSVDEVLETLLPKYVEVQIFRALLESAASEHGARMTAMDAASRSASEMIDSLTLRYNRARQAAITKELMEIIGGAEAL